jgi:hypothetical protein
MYEVMNRNHPKCISFSLHFYRRYHLSLWIKEMATFASPPLDFRVTDLGFAGTKTTITMPTRRYNAWQNPFAS